MKNLLKTIACMLVIGLALSSEPVCAKDLKASLARMPIYAESHDKGVLVDLVKAIQRVSGVPIEYQVVPFKRSMSDVVTRKVDFHLPLIKNPNIKESDLDYDNSTASIFHVNFTLYTNKNKPVERNRINDYAIETDAAHVQYFHKNIIPSSSLENSLKKVNIGRIDGFIFADSACDPIIKDLKLKNIKRELYRQYDVKIILPKGEHGKNVDNMLTAAIDKLKSTGEYEKIMGIIDMPFNDWQP